MTCAVVGNQFSKSSINCTSDLLLGKSGRLTALQGIYRGDIAIPGKKSLAHLRQKLDVIEMHYRRQLIDRNLVACCLGPDSSPQFGYNYFAIREYSSC